MFPYDIERTMKSCRKDGLILKPDRPISMIDIVFGDWAASNGAKQGELYSTDTTINGQTFYIVFVSSMQRDYSLTPALLNVQSAILKDNCAETSFCVFYLSPVWEFDGTNKTRYALLGETDKWTAVSRQRISGINIDSSQALVSVTIEGSTNEIVNLSVYHSVLSVVPIKCPILSMTGQARLVISPKMVTCSSIY